MTDEELAAAFGINIAELHAKIEARPRGVPRAHRSTEAWLVRVGRRVVGARGDRCVRHAARVTEGRAHLPSASEAIDAARR